MKQSSKKITFDLEFKSVFLTIFLCLSVLVGCASLPGGSIKKYPSEYQTTVQASSETLEELKIPVTETIADGLKTTLKAQRPDGTPVVVEVVRISRNSTEVSVRTGIVGFVDKRVADQINEIIYERLDKAKKNNSRPEITEENLDDRANQQLDSIAIADEAVQAWERTVRKKLQRFLTTLFSLFISVRIQKSFRVKQGKNLIGLLKSSAIILLQILPSMAIPIHTGTSPIMK
jgi:hypothetical protein